MSRLTEKKFLDDFKAIKNINPNYVASKEELMYEKLGKLEDIMEKYEIESLEELEELIKDYDDMAKSIVEMGLGIKVEIKGQE